MSENVAVWAALREIYAGYVAKDRSRMDARIDPDATVWDSAVPELLRGRADLDRVRDARPTGRDAPEVAELRPYDEVIDVWGDTAVARYWLRVSFAAGGGNPPPEELVRTTAVLRRTGGEWRVVHLHEGVVTER